MGNRKKDGRLHWCGNTSAAPDSLTKAANQARPATCAQAGRAYHGFTASKKDLHTMQKENTQPLGKNGFKYKPQFGLIIVCKDEAEQQKRYAALVRQGYKVKVVAV
ncbi:hypothetical protein [Vandammella animalimorsus]|uniref:hypothetical protein n=2 Tax=Vandammella animalimorsus TaxID=2029117 RepID=UPI0011786D6D|nr:hypothetical protein [Vandammella animalimorsus]